MTPPDVPPPKRRSQDYSHEVTVAQNPALRYLWLSLGLICAAVGIIGAFLPLLPTTGPLILAAYFFARSSPRFYNLIMNNRVFGPPIRDYLAGKGIPLRIKVLAVSLLLVGVTFSSLALNTVVVKLLLWSLALAGSLFILTRPTKAV